MIRRWLVCALVVHSASLFGQCPVADFTLPAAACLQEQLYPADQSTGASTYQWDFCSGELAATPTAAPVVSSPLFFRTGTMRVAKDGSQWIGFAIDFAFDRLIRLDFGADLANTPSLLDLGTLSGSLHTAFDFELYKEGSNWYALVVNSTSNNLIKISFGSTLMSLSLSVQNLGSFGALNTPNGIRLINDSGTLHAFVTNGGAAEVIRLTFGSSINNTPSVTSIPVPGAAGLRGIDLVKECNRWFGLAASNGNHKVFWLDFNAGLNQPPTTGEITFFTSYLFPASLSLAWDGDAYYAFIQSGLGSLYRLSFGQSILDANGTGVDLGDLGISSQNSALSLTKVNSMWHVFSIDMANQRLARVTFPQSCSPSIAAAIGSTPSVNYQAPGTHSITLEVTSASGTIDARSRSVTVSGSTAPDVDFNITNACVANPIQFTSINSSGGITGYQWDFGDGNGSASANPSYQYSTTGLFSIELDILASNGCHNRTRKSHQVLDDPIADFALPVVSPFCTNQTYTFTNTSSTDPLSAPVWEWRVNGSLVSGSQDLATTFSSAVSQQIRLKAIIPGCENEQIKNIATVLTGPSIDFSVSDDCASNFVPFTNASSGVDAGFDWDFGDGNHSSAVSPMHQYLAPANFNVKLTGSNSAGCSNFIILPVKIYSLPQPDFSVGLPPFSCSGTSTPFQNNTAPLTDSNLQDWFWSFGDAGSSTSTAFQPSFNYVLGGTYSVQLTATSNVGCSKTVTKMVDIGSSPVAGFTFGPACVNKPTQFTDGSIGAIQSRMWQMASSTYSAVNPTHVFSIPGTYPVTLTVTATGGCTSVLTQPVIVPVVPSLAIQTSNPCVDQVTIFNLVDQSNPIVDPVNDWQWNIAGTLATGNPVQQSIGLPGVTPISVLTTHASGCTYLLSSSVNVLISPVASFTASPVSGEGPLTVQFQNTTTGASQYQWTFNTSPPGFSSAVSPTYTFLELGDYTAQLTAILSNGCSDTAVVAIQVLVAEVDLEMLNLSVTPDASTGKLKSTITLRNNSNIAIPNVDVALHLSSLAVVNENLSVDLDPGESVTRTLSFVFSPEQLADGYVCVDLISEKDFQPDNNRMCVSLDEGDFILPPYPNPSSGNLRLDWISATTGVAHVTIYNSQGRREYEWETPSLPGLNQTQHDVAFLAPGVYLVAVQTPDAQRTLRFVKL